MGRLDKGSLRLSHAQPPGCWAVGRQGPWGSQALRHPGPRGSHRKAENRAGRQRAASIPGPEEKRGLQLVPAVKVLGLAVGLVVVVAGNAETFYRRLDYEETEALQAKAFFMAP